MNRALALSCLALVVSLASPPAARAGSYRVLACHGTAVADASWTPSASAQMAAYSSCPLDNAFPHRTGMVNRTVIQSGQASLPVFSYANHSFTAPTGASLGKITFIAALAINNPSVEGWRAGLWGVTSGGSAAKLWGDCPGGQCMGLGQAVGGPYTVDLAGYATAEFLLVCGKASCPATPFASSGNYYPRAHLNSGQVSVEVLDSTPPAVGATAGALAEPGWHRGTARVSYSASDNVGVRRTALLVDGSERAATDRPCDYSRRVPCPQVPADSYPLDTQLLADGAHSLRAGATDTAGNPAAGADRTILVDNHAPDAPSAVVLAGGEDWRRTNGFDVSWANPPGQAAPVVAAGYSLCPAKGPERCSAGRADGDGISSLSGVRVPGPGDWLLRVWLEDAAGNANPAALSSAAHLRFDDTGPDRLGFLASDPDDPRQLNAAIADDASGPAGGTIELRRAGTEEAWRAMPTRFSGDRLAARIDEDALPRGSYAFRVTGRDVAGNERSTDRRLEGPRAGEPLVLAVPVRLTTRIRLKIVAPRRRPGRPVKVAFGVRKRIFGALATAGGRPLRGARVWVYVRKFASGAAERVSGSLRTDSEGRFVYRAPAGPSRRLRFAYHGTNVLGAAQAAQGLLVPAALTLRPDRRRLRNGETVLFSGRVRGLPVPALGKLVNLQAFYRGRWRTFATVRATAAGGRFRVAYRFEATVGRVVYRFRAQSRREAAYPYELGYSPVARVTVTG